MDCKKFFVYILLTENNKLYCGWTDDVEARFNKHLQGKGAKFTRANKPVRIVFQREFNSKIEAQKEEYRIKNHLTRKQKEDLIKEFNQNFNA